MVAWSGVMGMVQHMRSDQILGSSSGGSRDGRLQSWRGLTLFSSRRECRLGTEVGEFVDWPTGS